MNKIWKFFQYGYLIVAIILLVETVLNWNHNREKAYLYLIFSTFITLVFFFKRHFRKKIEQKNKR